MSRRRLGRSAPVNARASERWGFWLWVGAAYGAVLLTLTVVGASDSSEPVQVPQALDLGVRQSTGGHLELGRIEEFLLLFAAVALIRRVYLAWLAYRPGPVLVVDFVDGRAPDAALVPSASGNDTERTPPLASIEAVARTNQFREALSIVRLFPPRDDTTRSSAQFLQLLRNPAMARTGLIDTIGGLVMFMRPTHAYRVTGMLQTRDTDQRTAPSMTCGITVQVTVLPGGTSGVRTYWAPTWERAVEQAANSVAAFVIPRSRAAKRPPWRSLRGLPLQAEVFDEFRTARLLLQERRYDEALASFAVVLRRHPGNLDLKMEVGAVQDRLGLFLDSLATYCDVVRRTSLVGQRNSLTLSRSRDHWLPRLRALLEKRRLTDPFFARFRLASTLGMTPKISSQWLEDRDVGPERQRERIDIRHRVRTVMLDWYEPNFNDHHLLGDYDMGELLNVDEDREYYPEKPQSSTVRIERTKVVKQEARATRGDPYSTAYRRLRLMVDLTFQVASRREIETLTDGFRWERLFVGANLSRRSLQVSGMLVEERIRAIEDELAALAGEGERRPPPDVDELRKSVDRTLHPPMRRSSRTWIDQYNAACVYAGALTGRLTYRQIRNEQATVIFDDEEDSLAQHAIHRLEEAIRFADITFVADRQNWILSEDPDLDALRSHPLFRAFEARQFVTTGRRPPRPPNVHRYEASRHVQHLIRDSAAAMEARWRQRQPGAAHADVATLQRWMADEVRIWDAMADVALNARHYPARLHLVREVNSTRLPAEPRLVVPYPSWADIISVEADDTMLDVVKAEVRHERNLLENRKKLYDALSLPGATPGRRSEGDRPDLPKSQRRTSAGSADASRSPQVQALRKNNTAWTRYLSRAQVADIDPPPIEKVVELAVSRAELWNRLTSWFANNDKGRAVVVALDWLPAAPSDRPADVGETTAPDDTAASPDQRTLVLPDPKQPSMTHSTTEK
jgi:hypothetical protein